GFNSATKLIFDVPSMKLTLFHVMVANHHIRKDTSSLNVIYYSAQLFRASRFVERTTFHYRTH
ncbi:hypothetical protein EOI26_25500, partial [Salmonella enterica]|nr:hypothetical protein [Salmonella enterica subsp. houtenae]EAR4660836.1 hypothetical protein [Salmonella enterica]